MMETMNYKEVADFLHINTGTLRNWVSQGKFTRPLKRQGVKGRVLFLRADVEAWLEEHARRKLNKKARSVKLDHDKRLTFNVKLFNDDDPAMTRILARVEELEAGDEEDGGATKHELSSAELRAVAKAFFDYAEERDRKKAGR